MTTRHPTRTTPGAGATASGKPAQKVGRIKAAFDSAAGLRRAAGALPTTATVNAT